MKGLVKVVALVGAGLLVIAGPVAADGHARVVISFDAQTDGVAEGVAVDHEGNVFTGLSAAGRMLRIDGGEGQPRTLMELDGLADGDFGLVGHAIGAGGELYSAVGSANPELNGVIKIDPDTGSWEHLDGTEAITMANGLAPGLGGLAVSDSMTGTIWEVAEDPQTGAATAEVWITDPLLMGTGAMPLPFPVGANGVALRDDTLYVGVTEQSAIVAVPVLDDGSAGEPYVFADLSGAVVDGIAFDEAGNLYIADPPAHTLWKLAVDGSLTAVADVDDGLSGPSSVALWDGPDGLVAYVSNQAIGDPATIKHGPSIIAVGLE
jgi:sugar lactone lactonase YvrE